MKKHPDLYAKAEAIEQKSAEAAIAKGKKPFYWRKDKTLTWLRERVEKEELDGLFEGVVPVADEPDAYDDTIDPDDVCTACSI